MPYTTMPPAMNHISHLTGILFKAVNACLNFRPCIFLLFLTYQIHQLIMIRRIECFRFNTENIRPRILLYHRCHVPGIAHDFPIHYNNTIVLIFCHAFYLSGKTFLKYLQNFLMCHLPITSERNIAGIRYLF